MWPSLAAKRERSSWTELPAAKNSAPRQQETVVEIERERGAERVLMRIARERELLVGMAGWMCHGS